MAPKRESKKRNEAEPKRTITEFDRNIPETKTDDGESLGKLNDGVEKKEKSHRASRQ